MDSENEQLIDHRGQNHRLDVVVAAFVLQAVAELAGLFEGAEVHFDAPSQCMEIADGFRRDA